jgi:hypothetical protein
MLDESSMDGYVVLAKSVFPLAAYVISISNVRSAARTRVALLSPSVQVQGDVLHVA